MMKNGRAYLEPAGSSPQCSARSRRAVADFPPVRRRAAILMLVICGLGCLVLIVWGLFQRSSLAGLEVSSGQIRVPEAAEFSVDEPTISGATAVPSPTGEDHHFGPLLVIPELGVSTGIGKASGDRHTLVNPPGRVPGLVAGSARLDAAEGVTVLAGHVWVKDRPGVFVGLNKLSPGNVVWLVDEDGEKQQFLVSSLREVPANDLPDMVWGSRSGGRGLVLVTCAGEVEVINGRRHFTKTLIVEAKASESSVRKET